MLVVNNTKVIPARLYALTERGAVVEVLLLKRYDMTSWEVLDAARKKGQNRDENENQRPTFPHRQGRDGDRGNRIVEFSFEGVFEDILSEAGTMPLPPYIKEKLADQTRYNTVYSKVDGFGRRAYRGPAFYEGIAGKAPR